MRRKDREVTDFQEILEIIKKCDVCRLALHDEDFPYIVPLNFGLDVQEEQVFLYFHAANKGTKLDLIAKDNRATFEMDCDHNLILYEEHMNCTMDYASVIGHGTIKILPEEEKFRALKILMRQYHAEDFPFSTDMMKVTTVLKMTVIEMVGKRRNNVHEKLRALPLAVLPVIALLSLFPC
jgi:nitroimidazol reductase NimA-like FMN-containing flavoprotein (pyridoxamine 5'-phosphate oxidase superfamily)